TPFARLKRVGSSPLPQGVRDTDLVLLDERCRKLLATGDPYFNPNLSLESSIPVPWSASQSRSDRQCLERTLNRLNATRDPARSVRAPRPQDRYTELAQNLVSQLDFNMSNVEASSQLHELNQGEIDIRSINWFIPPFQNAFYGGIYTILRFASFLKRQKG